MTADGSGIVGSPPRAPVRTPRGHVESVAEMTVVGWGLAADDGPVEVDFRVQGLPVSTRLVRLERPDVRAAFPDTRDETSGFAAELDASIWFLAGESGSVPLVVRFDGEPVSEAQLSTALLDEWWARMAALPPGEERERRMLRLLAHVAAAGGPARLAPDVALAVEREAGARGLAAALRERDVEQRIPRAERQLLRLEGFDGLVAFGWACDPALEPQEFRVTCNGSLVEAHVERQERGDVQQALDTVESQLGFRIELPPRIWALADADGRCMVDVFVQGRALPGCPLQVDPDALRAHVAGMMPAEGAARRLSAHALRHVGLLEQHGAALREAGLFSAEDHAAVEALMHALDPEGGRRAGDLVHRALNPAAPRHAGQGVRAALEAWQDLVLIGWVLDEAAGGEVFRLQCNGDDVECMVTRTHREDVHKALGLGNVSEYLGFEIVLPVRIWRRAESGACLLILLVNDRPLPFPPLRIDAAMLESATVRHLARPAVRALRVAAPEAVRTRSIAWRVVQHVLASGLAGGFGPEGQEAMRIGAVWLDEAVRHGLAGDDRRHDARAELLQRRRVWRLQRRFNALLGRPGGNAGEALDAILADVDATGAVRSQLLLSLVPVLCDDAAAIERVERELPLDVQAFHAARGNNWQRSLYLVGLARAGRFADACAVLERVIEAPTQGWLNTECVAFAVRHALAELDADDAPDPDADPDDAVSRPRLRFVYLFFALLDSLPGGYWSRRHDARLVESTAAIVAALAPDGGARAERIRDGALHHYGLVPSFWAQLDRLGVPDEPTLARAREDFESVRAAITAFDAGRRSPDAWREASERLRIQARVGRRVAMQALRELMLVDLQAARAAGDAEDVSWRFVWETASPADLRRLDAYPLPRPGAEQPAPRSLWPTPDAPPVADGAAPGPENRLDLCSPPAGVAALAAATVLVVCVVRNERMMLPHFLAHYRKLGARHFVFVDNGSDDGTTAYLLAQPDVVLYAAATDYRDSHYGVAWQQAVLAAHALGRWALVADADELLLYPGCETRSLDELVSGLDDAGHDAAPVLMLDMYPPGPLRDTDFEHVEPGSANCFDREPLLRWRLGAGLYSNAPTWLSALRHRLIPHSPPNAFTAQKVALLRYRPWVRLSEGLHYASGLEPSREPLFFGHYKYHAGFREKVLREIERKQHYDGASEYAHYLEMVAEPDASLFAPGVSVTLEGSAGLPTVEAAAVPRAGSRAANS